MSYKTQAIMAQDKHLNERIAACVAHEGEHQPLSWVAAYGWALSASPGWDEAYAYALAQEVADPGNDESVITDGMILSAVQAFRATLEV